MSLLARIGSEVKAISQEVKSLPFSSFGGNGYGGSTYAGLPHLSLINGSYSSNLPGTEYDYRAAAGVLWENPSAAACFVALTKAFAQARPYLEQRNGEEWEKVDTHPIVELISKPNDFYSGEKLFGVTLVCVLSHGAAFWRLERDGKADPVEIWYEPPSGTGTSGISPVWDSKNFIKEYLYFIDGKAQKEPIAREDVVMFRHGLHPSNPRLPWSPLGLGAREIATLNSASTYTGSLLRNSAVPSGMVSLEGAALASGTAPTPDQAREMKRQIKSGFRGDNVGEPFVSSLPWKWTPFNWSPAELSIDKLRQWPQGAVCALLGTPEIVAMLPTGDQPTYENLEASMRWWWNNTVIPLEDAFADEIETQLFPQFNLDPDDYRLAWDRSAVPALREDETEKHAIYREDYKAGVIDLHGARSKLGYDTDDKDKGIMHPSATAGNPQSEPVTPQEQAAQERLQAASQKPEKKAIEDVDTLDPEHVWTDDELDAFTEDDLKQALATSTPEMRELLRTQPNENA